MKKIFQINLFSLQCWKEDDAKGGSEPYIWPVLITFNDETKASPNIVRLSPPTEYRQVLMENMKAGNFASIPENIGKFSEFFDDTYKQCYFIIIVALLEKDEAPDGAMKNGYNAYRTAILEAIPNVVLSILGAGGDPRSIDFTSIKQEISSKVKSAIKDSLSNLQKLNVATGVLNMDDFVDFAYQIIDKPDGAPIMALNFQSEDKKNEYCILGVSHTEFAPVFKQIGREDLIISNSKIISIL